MPGFPGGFPGGYAGGYGGDTQSPLDAEIQVLYQIKKKKFVCNFDVSCQFYLGLESNVFKGSNTGNS